MTPSTTIYQDGPLTSASKEQAFTPLELGNEPMLIFDDDNDDILNPGPGLFDLLLACPFPFEIPPRSKEPPSPSFKL